MTLRAPSNTRQGNRSTNDARDQSVQGASETGAVPCITSCTDLVATASASRNTAALFEDRSNERSNSQRFVLPLICSTCRNARISTQKLEHFLNVQSSGLSSPSHLEHTHTNSTQLRSTLPHSTVLGCQVDIPVQTAGLGTALPVARRLTSRQRATGARGKRRECFRVLPAKQTLS